MSPDQLHAHTHTHTSTPVTKPHPFLTLQAVKDGEDIEQWDSGITPGEEGGAPGKSQQQSETDDTSQLLHQTTMFTHTSPPHLQQNHEEHETIHQQDHTHYTHHTHIEHHLICHPAAAQSERDR